ncbi:MAG: alpha-1,4-glucan--maltose-1-phosphate maltosyltransferase [Bacteroidetes bacterium]|nr:alpha-1,4-glucan--maltose-1-phosphate maltosyltransferase [Bacteroidota bacterium]
MSGQQRVIIENVQPQVDGGLYPSKRTIGENVIVSANIFGDGHDHIRAELLYKYGAQGSWKIVEMAHLVNDDWTGSFTVDQKGQYFFAVRAWIDHFETWYDGFKKKAAAGLNLKVELMEGAAFLREVANGDTALLTMADQFENSRFYDKSIETVRSADFEKLVHQRPLRQFVNQYPQEFEVRVEHKKALYSTWYELFPRSSALEYGRHGTFRDTARLLPRIAAMNFDVLYLPPIHPIGKLNRKGKNNNVKALPGETGSPWAIGSDEGGHKSIHPELGTIDDYKKLIEEARKHHIDVALDLAYQCAPDHPYVKEHPEWFRQRPDGSIQYAENPPKKYQDIYPFNFETANWKELWEELRSVVFFWIEAGVKIFRVDNPHTKPIPFWKWLIEEVNKKYSDIIFLSEAFTRPKIMASLAKVGFTQSYTYFTWRTGKQELTEYIEELVNGPSRNYFRPNFWPNTPDILPWQLQYQGENIFIIRLALAATLSASYGIYGPAYEFCDNQPIDGKEEYFNSEKFELKHYDWRRTNRMTDIITLLNKARKENAALQSTWNIEFCNIENPNLMAYVKATDDLSNIILMVVNLDQHTKQSGYVEIPKARLKIKGKINLKLVDLMTEEMFTWTQDWNFVELEPNKMPFHLFRVEVHESLM